MDVIMYQNPACGTSRITLGLIRNAGIEPHIIEYLKTPADAPPTAPAPRAGGLVVSIPHEPILPPGSCFCPQSARGRCLIASDEDRSANLGTRSRQTAAPAFAA